MLQKRPIAFFDLETYRNYFLCKFRFYADKTTREFVMFPGQALNRAGILQILATHTIVGFNSQGYDCPILALALSGADNYALKEANDTIIVRQMKFWEFYRAYNVNMPDFTDHIDVMELLPGVRIGLKTYMGIAHCKTIQDLPIDPSQDISPIERIRLSTYCGNDLEGTERMYEIAVEKEWLPLREHITADINIDVRSKSDAQIAEAITRARLGFKPQQTKRPVGYEFTYKAPANICFKTEQLQEVLRIVESSPFRIGVKDEETGDYEEDGTAKKSKIKMHKDIAAIRVRMGCSVYKFGAGGLHSQEHGIWYESTTTHEIVDSDVGSFYPKNIINEGLYPEQCGPQQLEIYSAVYVERIAAKKAGRKREGNSKKIVLNGWFGKLGNEYSMAYAPELLMQVTIGGQLRLLMLIEALELAGISVVSANTDGIVTRCPMLLKPVRDRIMKEWEALMELELEHVKYRGIYFRDVNNYFAITVPDKDGKIEVKRKGIFTKPEVGSGPSSSKAPHREICSDAVIAYVKDGTPLDETIYRCRDIRKFVTVRALGKGARAVHDGVELGKVVRWAYRRDYTGALHNSKSGNQLADSAGAWPLMTLPDAFPDWIDYEYYVNNARELLATLKVER